MVKLSLIINMPPISKDNYKQSVAVKQGNKFVCVPRLADYYKQYEEGIKEIVKQQMIKQNIEITDKKIWVTKLNFFFEREPTNSDFFNFGKSLFDALNKVVYEDDSQIIGFMGVGKKEKDKDNPRTEIEFSWERNK